MTTTGDMLYEASPTTAARLGIGTTGQILTVAGGIPSWATPAGGGVTSLNGQTGAITNTDVSAIGSYIVGRPRNATNYAINSTLAGSSLYSSLAAATWYGGDPTQFATSNAISSGLYSITGTSPGVGTWRCISPAFGDTSYGITGLWVRVS
jgi:hypothetical protein